MHRSILAAALVLALPAAADAQIESAMSAMPGALAGRSPHHAYRPANAATSCPAAMHSLPAGKLPTYGIAHVARAGCEGMTRAAESGSSRVQAAR